MKIFFKIVRLIIQKIVPEFFLLLLSRNKDPLSFFIKVLPQNNYYKPESWRNIKINEINYKLDISDAIDWWVYFQIKDNNINTLYKSCKAGFNIIDIGSNIGFVALNFAKIVGKDGFVIGFEPDKTSYKKFINNVKLNNFQNIKLENLGLGDKEGMYSMKITDISNLGMNKISNSDSGENIINIVTLDNYCNEHNITQIDLIKIDVEGYEMNVILGAKNIIINQKPILFIEIDDNNLIEQGFSAKMLLEFLLDNNYSCFNVENQKMINHTYDFSNCHFDILCYKQI